MGRTLARFTEYKAKLLLYAKTLEIRVTYKAEDGDGKYMPSCRTIVIDPDLDESSEIATLLHELGHATDDTLYTRAAYKRLSRAYQVIYRQKPTRAQKKAVLECERRAWFFARSVAKQLRIPLGKWFEKEAQTNLSEYARL